VTGARNGYRLGAHHPGHEVITPDPRSVPSSPRLPCKTFLKIGHILGRGALAFAIAGRRLSARADMQKFTSDALLRRLRMPARTSIHVGRPTWIGSHARARDVPSARACLKP
jgi:hypothetical protein